MPARGQPRTRALPQGCGLGPAMPLLSGHLRSARRQSPSARDLPDRSQIGRASLCLSPPPWAERPPLSPGPLRSFQNVPQRRVIASPRRVLQRVASDAFEPKCRSRFAVRGPARSDSCTRSEPIHRSSPGRHMPSSTPASCSPSDTKGPFAGLGRNALSAWKATPPQMPTRFLPSPFFRSLFKIGSSVLYPHLSAPAPALFFFLAFIPRHVLYQFAFFWRLICFLELECKLHKSRSFILMTAPPPSAMNSAWHIEGPKLKKFLNRLVKK